jgi:hypothetical protein
MRRIIVSRFSGVLSAYGIHLADIVLERQEACASVYSPASLPALQERLSALEATVRQSPGREHLTLDLKKLKSDKYRCERLLPRQPPRPARAALRPRGHGAIYTS